MSRPIDRLIAPHLDPQSRAYWEGRSLQQLGRRRISIFARNAYRHGVLGRFIGIAHVAARALRRRPARPSERALARGAAALLRDHAGAAVRQAARCAGRRPTGCRSTASASRRRSTRRWPAAATWARVLRSRVERLACGFSLDDNYFAWQAFGRALRRDAAGAAAALPAARALRRRARPGRSRRGAEPLDHRISRRLPRRLARPLRAARRPGLDDRRAAQRAVAPRSPAPRGPARA